MRIPRPLVIGNPPLQRLGRVVKISILDDGRRSNRRSGVQRGGDQGKAEEEKSHGVTPLCKREAGPDHGIFQDIRLACDVASVAIAPASAPDHVTL